MGKCIKHMRYAGQVERRWRTLLVHSPIWIICCIDTIPQSVHFLVSPCLVNLTILAMALEASHHQSRVAPGKRLGPLLYLAGCATELAVAEAEVFP